MPYGESPMWIGTEENPQITLIEENELVSYNSYVTIGRGYRFVLRQHRDEEPVLQMIHHGRNQDTDIIRNFHP